MTATHVWYDQLGYMKLDLASFLEPWTPTQINESRLSTVNDIHQFDE